MANEIDVSRDALLTTVDNPFDPFEEFDEWLVFDMQKGYNTCGLLARLTPEIAADSEFNEEIAIDVAMKKIVAHNPYGVHRLVYRKSNK